MRGLTFAAVAVMAAAAASAAVAQTQPTPTATPATSAPQTPVTASTESPAFSLNKMGPVTVAYNIGVASDYVFRGVSQTKENPAISGGVDFTYKSVYLGVWTSNLDFKPFGDRDTNEEIDLYGGYKTTLSTVSLDVGFIYYGYVNQPKGGPSVDYLEGYVKATKAFGPVTLGGGFYYSPDFTGETGDGEYFEGNAAWAIDKKWSVSGAIGRQEIEKVAGYTTWNLGVSYAITDALALDVRYYDTDEHGFGKVYGSRGVAALRFTF